MSALRNLSQAVVVDTTWNCAKKMVKRIPDSVPRVTLSADTFPAGPSLLYPIRKYDGPCEDRVCTYEAVLGYLEESGSLDAEQREWLLFNLKLKVDSLLMGRNRRAAYGVLGAEPAAAAEPFSWTRRAAAEAQEAEGRGASGAEAGGGGAAGTAAETAGDGVEDAAGAAAAGRAVSNSNGSHHHHRPQQGGSLEEEEEGGIGGAGGSSGGDKN